MSKKAITIAASIALAVIVLATAIYFGVVRFIDYLRVPIRTSQGEVVAESYSYNNSNGYKTMTVGLDATAISATVDPVQLKADLCAFVKASDWGKVGVTAKTANEITLLVTTTAETIRIDCLQ